MTPLPTIRRATALPLLVLALLPGRPARGSDAPHDLSSSQTISCTSCHIAHSAADGAITKIAGNANLCGSCHNSYGAAFAWVADDKAAVPGVSGHSHRWDATVGAATDTRVPAHAGMAQRLPGGRLQCSTCHDQHTGANGHRGRQRVSVPHGTGTTVTRTAGTGTGNLRLETPAADALARGFLVQIVAGGKTGTATFRVSFDNKFSWFAWDAPSSQWVPWDATHTAGRPTDASVALDNTGKVLGTFTTTGGQNFQAGDEWRFYVSYPFLRMANDASQMCEDCHAPRVQTTANVQGTAGGNLASIDFGTTEFSHPVGQPLARPYDRGAILDANGADQGAGDTVASNDMNLDASGNVRCLTCHGVHNADSNSLSEDPR